MFKNYFLTKLFFKIYYDLEFQAEYLNGITKTKGKDIKNDISLSNQKCHYNSYDLYKNNNNLEIKIVWCVNDEDYTGFIHFINQDNETKGFIDNTLGMEKDNYTYYIFNNTYLKRFVDKENVNPRKWLVWSKKDFYNKYCTNWLWKFFINWYDL